MARFQFMQCGTSQKQNMNKMDEVDPDVKQLQMHRAVSKTKVKRSEANWIDGSDDTNHDRNFRSTRASAMDGSARIWVVATI